MYRQVGETEMHRSSYNGHNPLQQPVNVYSQRTMQVPDDLSYQRRSVEHDQEVVTGTYSISEPIKHSRSKPSRSPSQEKKSPAKMMKAIFESPRPVSDQILALQKQNRQIKEDLSFYASLTNEPLIKEVEMLEEQLRIITKETQAIELSTKASLANHYLKSQIIRRQNLDNHIQSLSMQYFNDEGMAIEDLEKYLDKLKKDDEEMRTMPEKFIRKEMEKQLTSQQEHIKIINSILKM